jgi:hypothetical protein
MKKKLTRMTKIITDWKIREIFDVPDVAFSEFYNSYEHLTFDG